MEQYACASQNQVDQYAAFANVPADDVVNKALSLYLPKDRNFQQFREANPHGKASPALRVKKLIVAVIGANAFIESDALSINL